MQAAERLRGVQIENKPAVDLMQRFNYKNVLIYLDPPYVLSARHGKQYRCEMDDKDHAKLLETAKAHKGPVLISGYESDMYNDYLHNWTKESFNSQAEHAGPRTEVVWMNYSRQLNLMDIPGVMP